ncbi:restriction endonuclease subunit S [Methylomonas methanica]|uniref:restriction endonuclease subunit S n=1 Tax=Methylomonas methanica TaxID=421 RepID=UPI0009ED8180|nr:restriction endonuclease subunit S [Methylomonas methanica]
MNNSLPPSWVRCKFGDLVKISNGYAFKSSDFKKVKENDSDVPLVRQSQLKGSTVDLSDAVYLDCSNLTRFADYVIKKGDIIIGMSGSIGKVCEYKEDIPALQNQRTGRIQPFLENKLEPKFFGLFLSNVEHVLSERARGMGIQNISSKDIENLDFNLPPILEQNRIVAKIEALFSELDKGIESFKTAHEQLNIYRQALLKHAFSGKLTEQWRAENPDNLESAEALLQRIQTERQQRYQQQLKDWEQSKSPPAPLLQRGESGPSTGKENAAAATTPSITTDAVIPPFEKGGLGGISKPKPPKTLPPLTAEELAGLPELPSEWLKVKVSHLLAEDLCNGKSVKDRQGGFPVLRLNALIDGKIDLSISKEGDWTEIQAKNYLVKDGDFLVSRGNGSKHLVGRGGIARIQVGRNNFVAFPDTMIRIRLSNSLVYLDYFSFYWDSPVIRNQVEKTARTTAGIYKINQALIEDYVLPLPCLEEQKVISNLLDSSLSNIDQLDQTITTALQQAEALRQSILKKAFSGQLVPQDPSDEPASVLLERIRAEKAVSDKPKSRKTKHA